MINLTAQEAKQVVQGIKTPLDMKVHFGKVFMGGPYLGGSEPNTALEEYFERELISWVGIGNFTPSMAVDTLKLFQKFDQVYPAKLVIKSSKIWRGLAIQNNVKSDFLYKFIPSSGWKKEGAYYVKSGPYKAGAMRAVAQSGAQAESWTDVEGTALQFALNMDDYDRSKLNSPSSSQMRDVEKDILANHDVIMEQLEYIDSKKFGKSTDYAAEYKKNPSATTKALLEAMMNAETFSVYKNNVSSLMPFVLELNNKPNEFVFSSELLNMYSNKEFGEKENEVIRLTPTSSTTNVKWKLPAPIYEYLTVNKNIWGKVK